MKINVHALTALMDGATMMAKAYTKMVEAMVAEGVEEEDARQEARNMVFFAAYMEDENEGEACPLCGRGV